MLDILVQLPADRDRAGRLRLRDTAAPGKVLSVVWDCLGCAEHGFACICGNPARDPLRDGGHTPTGAYFAALVSPAPKPMSGYWIPLLPMSGQARAALDAGRVQTIGIHAGRGDGILLPTAGCVRMRDRDFHQLAQRLGGRPATITIEEA